MKALAAVLLLAACSSPDATTAPAAQYLPADTDKPWEDSP